MPISQASIFIICFQCVFVLSVDFTVNRTISRFVFASCSKTESDQSIFSKVNDLDPDLFVWLGDSGKKKSYDKMYNRNFYTKTIHFKYIIY